MKLRIQSFIRFCIASVVSAFRTTINNSLYFSASLYYYNNIFRNFEKEARKELGETNAKFVGAGERLAQTVVEECMSKYSESIDNQAFTARLKNGPTAFEIGKYIVFSKLLNNLTKIINTLVFNHIVQLETYADLSKDDNACLVRVYGKLGDRSFDIRTERGGEDFHGFTPAFPLLDFDAAKGMGVGSGERVGDPWFSNPVVNHKYFKFPQLCTNNVIEIGKRLTKDSWKALFVYIIVFIVLNLLSEGVQYTYPQFETVWLWLSFIAYSIAAFFFVANAALNFIIGFQVSAFKKLSQKADFLIQEILEVFKFASESEYVYLNDSCWVSFANHQIILSELNIKRGTGNDEDIELLEFYREFKRLLENSETPIDAITYFDSEA